MSWFTDLYRSAVGKKAVMAVTGIILFGFVLLHMVGNLKLYEGPETARTTTRGFLREVGAPAVPPSGLLWIARVGAARRRRAPHLGGLAAHADEPAARPRRATQQRDAGARRATRRAPCAGAA